MADFQDMIPEANSGIPVSNAQYANSDVSNDDSRKALESAISAVANTKPQITGGTSQPISPSEIDTSGRYPLQKIGYDNEQLYAEGQGVASKAFHGLEKMAGLATTTFLQGTLGLVYGAYKWADDNRFASIYDNDFNRKLDDINKWAENAAPNYYTARERDAKWYEPANILTANFVFDKIVKNIGFSLGSIAAGYGWGSLLKGIGLTAKLAQAGRAIQMSDELETALSTASSTERFGAMSNVLNKYEQIVPTLRNVAGGALQNSERAITAAFGTFGEAGMESLNNLNEFRNNMIAEFEKKNGYTPTGKDLDDINSYAEQVGNMSFGLNTALLTATNYIQLPKILGSSFKTEKAIANGLETSINPIVQGVEGQFVSGLPQKGIKKILFGAKNIGGLLFSPSEAFEEGSQYAIQTGTENFFNKKYHNQSANFFNDVVKYGYEQAVSTNEGMENILLGGLSGGLMQSGLIGAYTKQNGRQGFGILKGGEIGERGFFGTGGERARNTQEAINALNSSTFKNYMQDMVATNARAQDIQEQRAEAIQNGDELASKNLEFDYQHNYLQSRIKYGKMDFVKQDIENYRQAASTESGFEQLKQDGVVGPNESRDAFISRLNDFEKHAEYTNQLYQDLNLKYSGIINKETKERVYPQDVVDQLVYSGARILDTNNRLNNLSSELIQNGIDPTLANNSVQQMYSLMENYTTTGIADNIREQNIAKAIKDVEDQIDGMNVVQDKKDELKQSFNDYLTLSVQKNATIAQYNDILANPQKYSNKAEDQQETPTSIDVEGTSYDLNKPYNATSPQEYTVGKKDEMWQVKNPNGDVVRTFDNEKDAEIEKEVRNKDLANNLSSIQILGKKSNGSIIIRDKKGNIRTIPSSSLANYELEKSEEEKAKENEELNKNIESEQEVAVGETNSNIVTPEIEDSSEYDASSSKKPLDKLFKSSTYNNKTSGEKSFIIRQQEFLRNVEDFDNASDIKTILITPNNEKYYGLEGLSDMLLEGTGLDKNDEEVAPISQVFISIKDGKYFFVDKEGNTIKEVVGKEDNEKDQDLLDKVISAVMPTTALVWNNSGETRYSKGTPEEALAYQKAWSDKRKQLLSLTNNSEIYDFVVSRGVPVRNEKNENGERGRNAVGDTLIDNSKIGKQGIIKVVTTPTISINGEQVKFPLGSVIFQHGSTVEVLNNRKINEKEAINIYSLLNKFVQQANSNASTKFNRQILNYIQGVLRWGTPKENATGKQIWFSKGIFHIADLNVPFTTKGMEDNRLAIINKLQELYVNINNKYLKDNTSFEEITGIDEDGNFQTNLWKSYQHFIASNSYDLLEGDNNGKTRNINDIPLYTTISTPTEGRSNFIHKYSTVTTSNDGSSLFSVAQVANKQETPKLETVDIINSDGTPSGRSIEYKKVGDDYEAVNVIEADGTVRPPSNQQAANTLLKNLLVIEGVIEPQEQITSQEEPKEQAPKEEIPNENVQEVEIINADGSGSGRFIQYTQENGEYTPTGVREGNVVREPKNIEAAKTLLNNLLVINGVIEPQSINTSTEEEIQESAKEDAASPSQETEEDDSTVFEGDYRTVLNEKYNYVKANLDQEEKWFTERFNIPFNRMQNLIATTSGGFAFGQFKDAAVYIYENAEVGTTYHEAFETVWGMFSSLQERKNLINEFRNRSGEYIDRESGRTLNYSDATEHQVKEQLAEEFRDYVMNDELTYKPSAKQNKIYKFFKDLLNFIKKFFTGNANNEEELFKRIKSGYYKNASPKQTYYDEAGTYSKIPGLSVEDTYKVVNGVTAVVFQKLFSQGSASLVNFDENKRTQSEIYKDVYNELEKIYNGKGSNPLLVANLENPVLIELYRNLWDTIKKNWNLVTTLTNESLSTFGIKGDNNTIESEDGTYVSVDKEEKDDVITDRADSYLQDPFTFDFVNNAPTSVKLLFATLTKSQFKAATDALELSKVVSDIDPSTYMQQLVEYSSIFNQVMANVYNVNSLEEKKEKLLELSKSNPNIVRLYNRLKFNISPEKLSIDDWKLQARFFNVFAKQKPEALIQYIVKDRNGINVYTESANTNIANAELVQSWINNLKSPSSNFVNIVDDTYTFNAKALDKYSVSDVKNQIAFLNAFGIDWTQDMYNSLSKNKKGEFSTLVSNLYNTLKKQGGKTDLSAKSLSNAGNLKALANLYLQSSNQGLSSTYYNISGDRVQQYLQSNNINFITNGVNNAKDVNSFRDEYSQFNDVYRQDSIYLSQGGILFDEEGKRNNKKLNVQYIQGTNYITKEKAIENSALSESQRLLQEINQNLNKSFYLLVPADSKTESMMEMEHIFSFKDFSTSGIWNRINKQIEQYFNTEKQIAGKNYNGLLFPHFANEENNYDKDKFFEFVNNIVETNISNLSKTGLIKQDRNKFSIPELDSDFTKANSLSSMSEEELKQLFTFREINYIINNIELHKLFFGDVSKIKNSIKRYKSFISPREMSIVDNGFNNKLNEEYNTIAGVQLSLGTPGYIEFKNHMDTATIEDIITMTPSIVDDNHLPKAIRNAYTKNNVADAQSWATLPAYREINFKRGFNWTNAQERQFQYQMALDRQLIDKDTTDGIIPKELGWNYDSEELRKYDEELIKKGNPNSGIFNPMKPVGSGVTLAGNTFLDKTSVAPIFYSMFRGEGDSISVMALHYLKMNKQGLSYIITESGRKIGNIGMNSLYTENGMANTEEYKNIVQIPFSYYGIQVETGGEHNDNTLGSQLSKMASNNLISVGVPVDYEGEESTWNNLTESEKRSISPIYNEIRHNTEMLNELHKTGYDELLNRFGIEDKGDGYEITDKSKVEKLLKDELFRRQASINKKQSVKLDSETGEFVIPFEASIAYTEIKSILYSYVDKLIAKPKVNGGMKIQISAAGFEANGINKIVTKNGKSVLVSNHLKFYEATYNEKGERTSVSRMEILLPNWFADKLRKAGINMSNEELIDYLNSSEEGKQILNGVGFRIPTQDTNSVEAFTVKGFLPSSLGDSIIVPEAITTKAGSDFDVDKLNTYLKNIYIDGNKNIKIIPFLGVGEQAKKQFRDILDKFDTKEDVINSLFSQEDDELALGDLEERTNKMYRASIENEYFASLERLLLFPENFERLITPNSVDEIKSIRDDLVKLAPNEFGTSQSNSNSNILNSAYMSKVRHLFLIGKGGVGIAATAQTNNSLNQLSKIVIEPENIKSVPTIQRIYLTGEWLVKDSVYSGIRLPHNQVDGKATLSKSTDVKGRVISDKISQYLNGFVDIAQDPFISQIIQSPILSGTFLLLEKLGVEGKMVGLFMNQPIIREYIKLLSNSGNTWLYNSEFIKSNLLHLFPSKLATPIDKEFTNERLSNTIKKFYNGETLSQEENEFQKLVLVEFLKYSVLANNLFDIVRGSTYDTDVSSDPNMRIRKEFLTDRAQHKNMFSSVDNLLSNSFLGPLAITTGKATDAIQSTLFKTGSDTARNVINPILDSLLNMKGMSQLTYSKSAKQVEQELLTYLVQTNTGLNGRIKELMIDTTTSIANELLNIKRELNKTNNDLRKNTVLQKLVPLIGNKASSAKLVTLLFKVNDAFTSDIYTDAFRELRSNPITSKLYGDLIRISLLQSGIGRSAISFTQYLPYEDFQKAITPIINDLDEKQNIANFAELGMFFKNQWNNSDIVPQMVEKFFEDATSSRYGQSKNKFPTKWYADLKTANGIKSVFNTLYKVDYRSSAASAPFITMFVYGSMEAAQNFEGEQKVLLKRLDNEDGSPVRQYYSNSTTDYHMIYYPVNALGNGYNGKEYYDELRSSVYNNGFIKIPREFSNEEVLGAYNDYFGITSSPEQEEQVVERQSPEVKEELSPKVDTNKIIDTLEQNNQIEKNCK